MTLDLTQPGDRVLLDSLLSRSHVVDDVLPVDSAAYGLESRASCERHPQLIVTTISPFGDSGPRANYRAYELNAFHASGMASLIPLGSPYPDLPPLKIYGNQAELMAGLRGSLVTLAAERIVRAGFHGRGPARRHPQLPGSTARRSAGLFCHPRQQFHAGTFHAFPTVGLSAAGYPGTTYHFPQFASRNFAFY